MHCLCVCVPKCLNPAHTAFVRSVLPVDVLTADTEHAVAHHQHSHLTYVHLLLKLYCFGAILTHLCCVRLQLRLCMHSPPSPVPNPCSVWCNTDNVCT